MASSSSSESEAADATDDVQVGIYCTLYPPIDKSYLITNFEVKYLFQKALLKSSYIFLWQVKTTLTEDEAFMNDVALVRRLIPNRSAEEVEERLRQHSANPSRVQVKR